MEKIVSRPYDKSGEETFVRVFGDRGIPNYMVADKHTVDEKDQTRKESEKHD